MYDFIIISLVDNEYFAEFGHDNINSISIYIAR